MTKPDYANPPPHYQVMTIGQARQEYPEFSTFRIKDYCKSFEIKDEHWCYVWHLKGWLSAKRKPISLASGYDGDKVSHFVTREEACRMAWLSFVRFEYLTDGLTMREIDRVIGRFQKDGKL